jgi:hypothetical protein
MQHMCWAVRAVRSHHCIWLRALHIPLCLSFKSEKRLLSGLPALVDVLTAMCSLCMRLVTKAEMHVPFEFSGF